MVSPDIQGLGLSDKLLEHYKREVGEMALGILDGKPFDSPVHEGILLTCMLELLPYDDSDKSEFSEERLHSYLSRLNDEIIEEERKKEPPELESAYDILLQLQRTQAVGQMAGQMETLFRRRTPSKFSGARFRNTKPQLRMFPAVVGAPLLAIL
jgi:hypothetical protein